MQRFPRSRGRHLSNEGEIYDEYHTAQQCPPIPRVNQRHHSEVPSENVLYQNPMIPGENVSPDDQYSRPLFSSAEPNNMVCSEGDLYNWPRQRSNYYASPQYSAYTQRYPCNAPSMPCSKPKKFTDFPPTTNNGICSKYAGLSLSFSTDNHFTASHAETPQFFKSESGFVGNQSDSVSQPDYNFTSCDSSLVKLYSSVLSSSSSKSNSDEPQMENKVKQITNLSSNYNSFLSCDNLSSVAVTEDTPVIDAKVAPGNILVSNETRVSATNIKCNRTVSNYENSTSESHDTFSYYSEFQISLKHNSSQVKNEEQTRNIFPYNEDSFKVNDIDPAMQTRNIFPSNVSSFGIDNTDTVMETRGTFSSKDDSFTIKRIDSNMSTMNTFHSEDIFTKKDTDPKIQTMDSFFSNDGSFTKSDICPVMQENSTFASNDASFTINDISSAMQTKSISSNDNSFIINNIDTTMETRNSFFSNNDSFIVENTDSKMKSMNYFYSNDNFIMKDIDPKIQTMNSFPSSEDNFTINDTDVATQARNIFSSNDGSRTINDICSAMQKKSTFASNDGSFIINDICSAMQTKSTISSNVNNVTINNTDPVIVFSSTDSEKTFDCNQLQNKETKVQHYQGHDSSRKLESTFENIAKKEVHLGECYGVTIEKQDLVSDTESSGNGTDKVSEHSSIWDELKKTRWYSIDYVGDEQKQKTLHKS